MRISVPWQPGGPIVSKPVCDTVYSLIIFFKTKFKLILIIPPLLLYLILFLFSPLPNEINQLVFYSTLPQTSILQHLCFSRTLQ